VAGHGRWRPRSCRADNLSLAMDIRCEREEGRSRAGILWRLGRVMDASRDGSDPVVMCSLGGVRACSYQWS
jgi:hypothetical protein